MSRDVLGRRSHPQRTLVAVVAVVLATVAVVTPTSAAILTYPGVAPCNTTLQACIDAAVAGDIVEIATNTAIAESPEIVRSLTLRSAAGYSAALASGEYVNAWVSGSDSATFVLENLRLVWGVVLVSNSGTGTVTATIDDLNIDAFATNPALRLWNNSTGTMNLTVTDCTVHVPAPFSGSTYGISIIQSYAGSITAHILRNSFTVDGTYQGDVIEVALGAGSATADIIGNTITGADFNSGISLYGYGNGTINGRVINNLVVGQVSNAGAPASISINGSGEGATMSFTVVNNTLADGDTGILISGRSDLGASMSGLVANNIIASCPHSLSIDEVFSGTVANSHNTIFGDSYSWFTAGPETWWVNPGFVGGGDYHLLPTSFAVNTGTNAAVPGDVTTDLDGNPRIYEGTVDRGAYELQEPRQLIVSAIPTVSRSGLLLLVAALALLGVLLVRRSHFV